MKIHLVMGIHSKKKFGKLGYVVFVKCFFLGKYREGEKMFTPFRLQNPNLAPCFPPPILPTTGQTPLEQPDPSKNQKHGKRERKPGSPANACAAFGHAEHAVHGAFEAGASIVEAVVHVGGEGGGGSDFGRDGEGDLYFI